MRTKQYIFNQAALRRGYRSGLEDLVAQQLKSLSINFHYESKDDRIEYVRPQSNHKYSPDFTFPSSQIIIETKGHFTSQDRRKHLLIKQQHPELDIRFVFSNSKTKISKKSTTTYAKWAETHGFLYADKTIPPAWIKEIQHGNK